MPGVGTFVWATATAGALWRTDVCPAGHPLPLGLHDSVRPVLPRPPTISNPPPLISSTKHPSVLERQMSAISQVRREARRRPSHQVSVWPGARRTAPSSFEGSVFPSVKWGHRELGGSWVPKGLGSSFCTAVLGPQLA